MEGEQFSFGRFRLDLGRRELLHDEKPVRLGSRALDILCVLASSEGKVVSKDELMARVWLGAVVEENNLHVHISALRKALDEEEEESTYLVTVPGRGYRFDRPVKGETGSARTAPVSQPPTAPRLSIVVLPFTNLSDDREQQYFADGISEDLTTDLSRLENMFVISRNTAFTYWNKPIDTKQIGRELCVRYILEGSVRRSGKQVRVNAQLIDAETDTHLWAERFDRDAGDLFALQDEITSRIAIAFNPELIRAEAARRTEHPDALEFILRARAANAKPPSPDGVAAVINLYEHALVIDPRSVEAQSRLAAVLASRVLGDMTASATADIERARGLSEQALATLPHSPLAHYAKGQLLRAQRRYAEAIPEYEALLALDRNWVYAFFALGQCKLYTGSIEETIPLIDQALRLSPRDHALGLWYWQIGLVHLLQSHTDEAINWLEKARNHTSAHATMRAQLAAAYALIGKSERAVVELGEAHRLSTDGRFKSIAQVKAAGAYFGLAPKIRILYEATFLAGLRKAGMPEE
jgi:TolB-like protein